MWSGKKEWFFLKENQQVSEHSQPAHKWQYFITYGQCIGSINIQTSKLNHIQNPSQKYEQRRLIVYLWRDTVAADNTNTNKPVTTQGWWRDEMRWCNCDTFSDCQCMLRLARTLPLLWATGTSSSSGHWVVSHNSSGGGGGGVISSCGVTSSINTESCGATLHSIASR